jgi:CPA2 family monovalent cation:H+ antiporter-2
MHGHEDELLVTTLLLLSAVGLGLFFRILRQPPMVGYILAGLGLGPSGLGLIGYSDAMSTLAELGVILLLYIIGIHLSIKAFLKVLRPAAVATFGQTLICVGLAALASHYLDLSLPEIILVGFVLTLSSTAVALMVLEGFGLQRTHAGQLTVGVLIAQDILVVPMLVFAESGNAMIDAWQILLVRMVLSLLVLGGVLYWIGRTVRVRLPLFDVVEDNVELAVLLGLGVCCLAASFSGYLGLSPVFGAFCAGLVISHTNLRKPVLAAAQPLQSLLLVVFFVSIGLLVDSAYVRANIGLVVGITVAVRRFWAGGCCSLLACLQGVPWCRRLSPRRLASSVSCWPPAAWRRAYSHLVRRIFCLPLSRPACWYRRYGAASCITW